MTIFGTINHSPYFTSCGMRAVRLSFPSRRDITLISMSMKLLQRKGSGGVGDANTATEREPNCVCDIPRRTTRDVLVVEMILHA